MSKKGRITVTLSEVKAQLITECAKSGAKACVIATTDGKTARISLRGNEDEVLQLITKCFDVVKRGQKKCHR